MLWGSFTSTRVPSNWVLLLIAYDSQEAIRWQNGATSSGCACANRLETLGKPLQVKFSHPLKKVGCTEQAWRCEGVCAR
jgi:hypothetical protein